MRAYAQRLLARQCEEQARARACLIKLAGFSRGGQADLEESYSSLASMHSCRGGGKKPVLEEARAREALVGSYAMRRRVATASCSAIR